MSLICASGGFPGGGSTSERPAHNAETVREKLGGGHRLLRVADWQEGIVLPADDRTRSVTATRSRR